MEDLIAAGSASSSFRSDRILPVLGICARQKQIRMGGEAGLVGRLRIPLYGPKTEPRQLDCGQEEPSDDAI